MTRSLLCKRYREEENYWRTREFLRRVLVLNRLNQFSWHVARLDYWRWHAIQNCQSSDPLDQVMFIWETLSGEMAAVLNTEERGEVFLQVHPEMNTPGPIEEMLNVADAHLAVSAPNGRCTMNIWNGIAIFNAVPLIAAIWILSP